MVELHRRAEQSRANQLQESIEQLREIGDWKLFQWKAELKKIRWIVWQKKDIQKEITVVV
jgi:hypothetical protein